MGIKFNIKKAIIEKKIRAQNVKEPFQLLKSEQFQLDYDGDFYKINSYYFSAHHAEGESLFIRKAVRGNQTAEVWFCYHTKEATYVNTIQTFSSLDTSVDVTLIEVGKKWKFSFHGEVSKTKIDAFKVAHLTDEVIRIYVEGIFDATTEIFDFVTHLKPSLTAEAFAKEKWDHVWKERMKLNQQAHYEQQGIMSATINLNGQSKAFTSIAMRDHSFGRRDWNYMERHIWLMTLLNESTSVNYNLVKYPHVQNLKTGYYDKNNIVTQIAKGTTMQKMPTLSEMPFDFYYHIELDEQPKHLDIHTITEVIVPFVMQDGDYTVYETIACFQVNDEKGRGIAEFGFSKDKSNWVFK